MRVACILTYDEERTIASVIVRARSHVDRVLVCDDGSSDLTGEIADGLGAIVIMHSSNQGKGAALRPLFARCRELAADAMVTIDGDGQHNPDETPLLFDALDAGRSDVIMGSRFLKNGSSVPGYQESGNKLLNRVTASKATDTQSGSRPYSKRSIHDLLPAEMGMGADSELLMDALGHGLVVAEVPVA